MFCEYVGSDADQSIILRSTWLDATSSKGWTSTQWINAATTAHNTNSTTATASTTPSDPNTRRCRPTAQRWTIFSLLCTHFRSDLVVVRRPPGTLFLFLLPFHHLPTPPQHDNKLNKSEEEEKRREFLPPNPRKKIIFVWKKWRMSPSTGNFLFEIEILLRKKLFTNQLFTLFCVFLFGRKLLQLALALIFTGSLWVFRFSPSQKKGRASFQTDCLLFFSHFKSLFHFSFTFFHFYTSFWVLFSSFPIFSTKFL